ncbi:MAG: hypothetical protein KF760_04650 [Candidatus Eremiobacteraeota bacterium]|nr:hypothetical protein [Candidatus Eremiobacteraeota bacterium]MCW5866963.1 hypothetical protein [Candidatus Eremiobacteraeota bacterium]
MDSLIDRLGGEFEQLDALLTSLDEVAGRLEVQLSDGRLRLEGLAQRVEASSEQARQEWAEAAPRLGAQLPPLKAEASMLSQQTSALQRQSRQFETDFLAELRETASVVERFSQQLNAPLEEWALSLREGRPAAQELQAAATAGLTAWQAQTQVLLGRLASLDKELESHSAPLQNHGQLLWQSLAQWQRQLILDREQTGPEAARPVQRILSDELPETSDSLCQGQGKLLEQQFELWLKAAETRRTATADALTALYAGLNEYCALTLPQLLAECLQQRAAPAVQRTRAAILRIQAWVHRSGEFTTQFGRLMPATRAVLTFFAQMQDPASTGQALAQSSPTSGWGSAPPAQLSNPEPVQQGRRSEVSWALPPQVGLGFSATQTLSQTSAQTAPALVSSDRGRQETAAERQAGAGGGASPRTLSPINQGGPQGTDLSGLGVGPGGGFDSGSSSGLDSSRSGSPQTIGGFEDNSRELYDKMQGGQNTPEETLERMRQETAAKAQRLEAERQAARLAGEAPPIQQASSSHTSHGGHHGTSHGTHGGPGAGAGGGASSGSGGGHDSSRSGSPQTIGGFEDNSRELYDKMQGGQNTPEETLERMRQETAAKAQRLAAERQAARSASMQEAPPKINLGFLRDGQGQGVPPRIHLGSPKRKPEEPEV